MTIKNPLYPLVNYQPANFLPDLTAGFSVFLVAVPLCMGIALASGGPLLAGLIAGIIGGVIVGLLSDSEVSVSGPAAGLAVIVAEAIRTSGTYEAFLVAVVLAGLIQIGLGFLKAGRLSSFFPNSVIQGMTVGIGIVIILKQIPHALGRDTDYEGEFEFSQLADSENTLSEIYRSVVTASPGALVISAVSLLILIYWNKLAVGRLQFLNRVPSALLVVLAGIGLNQFFARFLPDFYLGDSNEHMVRIPVPTADKGFLSILDFPDFSVLATGRIYGVAATIALVASVETLLNLEASDRLDPFRRVSSANQELVAQGIGNVLSGLVGGLPITSVVVRTSANVFGGSRSRLSSILHGLMLIGALFLAASVLNHIPLSCLAALLIVVGYKLANPAIFKAIYRAGPNQFFPFLITVLVILFTDLLIGIVVGSAVGLAFVLYTNSHTSFRVVRDGQNVRINLQRDIHFLSKPQLKETLRLLKSGDSVLIDGSDATFIDNDIYTLLTDFAQTAKTLGIKYELRDVSQHKQRLPDYA